MCGDVIMHKKDRKKVANFIPEAIVYRKLRSQGSRITKTQPDVILS